MRIVIKNLDQTQNTLQKDQLSVHHSVLNMIRSIGFIMETLTEGIGAGIGEVREIMKREMQCIGSFFYNAICFCNHMGWKAEEVFTGEYDLTLGIPLFDFKTRASVMGGGLPAPGIWVMYLGRLVCHVDTLAPSEEDTLRAKVCLRESAALFYGIALKRGYEIDRYLDFAVKALETVKA